MLIVDSTCPVNWQHSLNHGLAAWFLAGVQGRTGGAKWYDLVRNRVGTLTNMDPKTDWLGTSRPGGSGALDFDGTDDIVSAASSSSIEYSVTSKFSVAMWFYGINSTSSSILTHSWINAGTNRSWTFGLSSSTSFTLRLFARGTSTDNVGTVTTGLHDGKWHFGAFVFNAGTVRVFLDGKFEASKSLVLGSGNIYTAGYPFLIGAQHLNSPTSYANWHPGKLDDIRIWNRALSDQQVHAYYDLSRQGYPGLLNRADRVLGKIPAVGGFKAGWASHANSLITGITSA